MSFAPIKLFACNLNWTMQDKPFRHCPPSAPQDWAIWENHPMLRESDGLFAESSDDSVVEWLLEVRQPGQRVMTTVIGRLDGEHCDPNSWRKWVSRGCDLMGYAWGTPPDFRPHPSYEAGLKIIREAFAALPGAPR